MAPKKQEFCFVFSLCSIIIWTIIFGLDTSLEEITVENKSKYTNTAIWLTVMIPAQYLNYIIGMIVILLVSLFMIMPIQIELYRRKHKAIENKNTFKAIIVSLGFLISLIVA